MRPRKWSFTRAFFLFWAGIFWLAIQVYPLVVDPAKRTPLAVLWLAAPLAFIYVGWRFNHLVARTPHVIYYLLYFAMALTTLGVGVALAKGLPPAAAGAPQPPALWYYASLVVFGAVAVLIWGALLRSVRRHAAAAASLSQGEDGSA